MPPRERGVGSKFFYKSITCLMNIAPYIILVKINSKCNSSFLSKHLQNKLISMHIFNTSGILTAQQLKKKSVLIKLRDLIEKVLFILTHNISCALLNLKYSLKHFKMHKHAQYTFIITTIKK